jgi:prefoldin subunit 2
MVGGVLLEQTIKDVLPAVTKNRDGVCLLVVKQPQISEIITELNNQYTKKDKELQEFARKFDIRVGGEEGADEGSKSKELAKPTSGVLV